MMKKIFIAMMAGICIGVPFFAFSAGSCTPDGWRATQASCVTSGGTWTTDDGTRIDSSGIIFSPTGNIRGSTAPSGSTVGLSANTQLKNPIKYDTFSQFAAAVTKTAVQVLLPLIVLAFIYSGFLFVKAQGNVEELKTAKTAILYSMLGAFILLGAWGFAQIIGQTVSTITQ